MTKIIKIDDKFRRGSVPNQIIGEVMNGSMDSKKQKYISEIDSEIIENDSIVDFDEQVEEIQNVEDSNLDFDDSGHEQIDAESFERDTPKVSVKDVDGFEKIIKSSKQLQLPIVKENPNPSLEDSRKQDAMNYRKLQNNYPLTTF